MSIEELPPEAEEAGEIVAPVEEVTEEAPSPPSIEDVAARMGWSPKDQWRGDPDKWKPADQFVVDTADVNARLGSKLSKLENQFETVARTNAAIMEQKLAEQRQQLLDERQAAWDAYDSEKFTEAEKKLKQLDATPNVQTPAPEAQDFIERNKSWWNVDPEATKWAQTRAGQLAEQGLGPARQIAIVEREMRDYFPDLVKTEEKKPAAKPAPLNQPGSRSNSQPKGKTFATLPPDVQKVALEFERSGKCTKEQYAKIYHEEQEA